MGKLIYATNNSLDGFTEDASGSFDWSEPGEDVHEFYNDMMSSIGTQLLGRRMHETMAVWETEPSLLEESPVLADFAAHALRSGLVDEIRLMFFPVTVGSGKRAFPTDLRLDLELIDERLFGNGVVHVGYRVRN